MTPQATVEAFWSALGRRTWQEAADLIHPDDAARRQRSDLNMIGACLAANEWREASGGAVGGLMVVETPDLDLTLGFRDRPVSSFPGAPLLGELASLPPSVFLARSFAAQAHRGERLVGPKLGLPQFEVVRTVEDSPDGAYVEFRAPELEPDDEDDGIHRVSLRRYAGSWRLQLELDEFTAPLPWAGEL